jgi:hypothetical protein
VSNIVIFGVLQSSSGMGSFYHRGSTPLGQLVATVEHHDNNSFHTTTRRKKSLSRRKLTEQQQQQNEIRQGDDDVDDDATDNDFCSPSPELQ